MINTVKGKALEVAEYLTPVLKVSRAGLAGGCLAHSQLCKDLAPEETDPCSPTGNSVGRCMGGTQRRGSPHPWSSPAVG